MGETNARLTPSRTFEIAGASWGTLHSAAESTSVSGTVSVPALGSCSRDSSLRVKRVSNQGGCRCEKNLRVGKAWRLLVEPHEARKAVERRAPCGFVRLFGYGDGVIHDCNMRYYSENKEQALGEIGGECILLLRSCIRSTGRSSFFLIRARSGRGWWITRALIGES